MLELTTIARATTREDLIAHLEDVIEHLLEGSSKDSATNDIGVYSFSVMEYDEG